MSVGNIYIIRDLIYAQFIVSLCMRAVAKLQIEKNIRNLIQRLSFMEESVKGGGCFECKDGRQ